MNVKYLLMGLAGLLVASCSNSCNKGSNNTPALEEKGGLEMYPEFINRIMPELGKGVTGGDGAISIDLKNGRSMFMWGDCFIGDVVNNKHVSPTYFIMGNVFTVLSKDTVVSYRRGTKTQPTSWIAPEPRGGNTVNWYWPGHGFVRDGILHLFMSEFYKSGDGSFDFVYLGCDYFRLDPNTLTIIDKQNFPAANVNDVHYGHAVLDDGKYIYSYGTKTDVNGFGYVHMARSEMVNNRLTNWTYYNGEEWVTNPSETKALEGVKTSVSEQFNVFKMNNKYILVTQTRGFTNRVFSAISDTPTGPFYNEKQIFKVEEPLAEKKMMTYNTMVHPQFQDKGRVLMCYNVNTTDFFAIYKDATLYKPRFFWMPIDTMLE
ncbi:MAG: DUF4185 domain-containing protein [Prevotellaceae bacterium]|jgi:hypothetical protein|nr:DUF4185 domain-containing protein [Prevotellaceae bacterium]